MAISAKSTASGLEVVVEHSAFSVQLNDRQLYQIYGAPKPDGVTEKSLDLSLPKNAVVRKFEVVMGVATAHAVTAGEAGQVRTMPASGGGLSVVLDFGTPRTVSAVQAPSGTLIKQISTWIGTEFAAPPKFTSASGDNYVTLPSEVRTERLQLVVTGNPSTTSLGTDTVLVLPESPSGIELRIDGGAPVFSQTAAIDPVSSADLTATSWNSNSERFVDLASALTALTGDPLDQTPLTLHAKLTSAVPGKLSLALRPGGQSVSRIRRAMFNGQPQTDLAFDLEGRSTLALAGLPSALTVESVQLTAVGAAPAMRVVPPVGPAVPSPAFADFTFAASRAAIIQLPIEPRFKEFNAVRLPLAAASAGAEARVLLWRSKDLVDLSPVSVMDNGASDPVTIPAGEEDWRTFSWKKPIPAPKDFVLWAALIVNRGTASMVFAAAGGGPGAERFLWGAPTGPWHDLPDALSAARGRIRLVGTPKPDAVYPPLQIALAAGGAADVTPNPKGTAVAIAGPHAVQTGQTALILTSHAPATVTLKNIDVISTT